MSQSNPALGSIIVSGAKPITNFHYLNRRFPEAKTTEFPKWVNMPGYESVVADDAEMERVLLSRPEIKLVPPPRKIVSSHPIVMQNGMQMSSVPVRIVQKVWWKRALLWLAHVLEEWAK